MRMAQGWRNPAGNVQSDRMEEEGEIPEQFHGGWTVPVSDSTAASPFPAYNVPT